MGGRCCVNNDEYEEIIAYNDLLDHISKAGNDKDQVLWKFRRITGHEGPLTSDNSSYRGSLYNVMIEWENGEITSEPLLTIAADDPVTCAIYARENNLLDLPGWKRIKGIAKWQKKMFRMANQAKLRSYRTTPKYQYGFEVPRDHPELDDTELLDEDGIRQYQSLIGSLQWAISLGRFDISIAVMMLSGFRSAPRKGHLERAKRIIGYLYKMKHAVLRFKVKEPDYSDVPGFDYDWSDIYRPVQELLPTNAPEPLVTILLSPTMSMLILCTTY